MLSTLGNKTATAAVAIPGYPSDHPVAPNMRDYAAFSRGITWEGARLELDGLPRSARLRFNRRRSSDIGEASAKGRN